MVAKNKERREQYDEDVYHQIPAQQADVLLDSSGIVEASYQVACFTVFEKGQRQKKELFQKASYKAIVEILALLIQEEAS